MLMRIYSPNIAIGRTLRSKIEHCFRIAADPVSDQIHWAGIQIARVSGPLGRPGFRCQISITLHSAESVFVEELNQSLERALSRATMGSRRAILRKTGEFPSITRQVHEAEVHYVDEKVPVIRRNHVPAKH